MAINKQSLQLYIRLLGYIKPYKFWIALTLFMLVLIAAMEPATAAVFKDLVDKSLIEKDPDSFIILPLLLMGIFVIKGIAEYFSQVASQWIAQKAVLEIRAQMHRKMQFLPLPKFQSYSTGGLMSKITYDVAQTSSALSEAWIVVIRDTLIVLALFGYMLYVSWELTLLALIIGPIAGWIINKVSQLMRTASRNLQTDMGQLTHQLEEGLVGHRDVKIYGAETYEQQRFHHTAENLFNHTMAATKVSALSAPLVQVLAAIALAIVIFAAMKMAADDMFTPGELLAYVTAMALTFEPIRRLTKINLVIQKGMAAAESIFDLLDQPEEMDSGSLKPAIQGELVLANMSFNYQNSDKPALNQINLTIPSNQTTALVGQSGSGKTTLVNMIARFYQPTSGQILLDGKDLQQIELNHLRQHIAFVSQNVVLFNDTVRANIAYGRDDYSDEAIIQAAKDAHAWEFIQKLADGLDTNIGENGSALSGGQRQRLVIARAFLKNAPILILDEATSALDNRSEAKIQQAMNQLRQNRTVIIIAHRLSTIENADQIVVMEQGEIKEIGKHQDLLQQNGVYAQLYQQGNL